jgi:hypothetical protein
MTDLPADPFHGNSTGGGPFPGSTIEHPAWCDTPNCHVTVGVGGAFGAHRSKKVTLPGRIEVRLSIWALHGTPAAIAFDILDETAAEGLRDVEVPAFVAEVPLTLGELLGESGVLLDIEEARTAARVMLELARQAEAS